jgi:hypothetical protein
MAILSSLAEGAGAIHIKSPLFPWTSEDAYGLTAAHLGGRLRIYAIGDNIRK